MIFLWPWLGALAGWLALYFGLARAMSGNGRKISRPARHRMPAWLDASERGYLDVAPRYPRLGVVAARDATYDMSRLKFITAATDYAADRAFANMLQNVRSDRELWPPYSRKECRAVAHGDGKNHAR
jgi:hypothetical protein